MKCRRITLVISSLNGGGAERVMSIMANYWAAKGLQVTLLTWAGAEEPIRYPVNPAVNLLPLGVASMRGNAVVSLNNLRRLFALRRAIRDSRPDAVISFLDKVNVTVILATRGLRVPVVVSEHVNPVMSPLGVVWETARKTTYRWADRVIVLTKRAGASFPQPVRARIRVIPNPVLLPSNDEGKAWDIRQPSVLAMGRLVELKGFDLLISAFAETRARFPAWVLTILGEGPERRRLEALCNELGVSKHVAFPGWVHNPYPLLQQADIFVLSSRNEAFPMVLCEAMIRGRAVISTDCPTGPREIIADGKDGILVPPEDVSALAAAMERLMADETERQRLGEAARGVVERFSLERVMGMWEALLADVMTERTRRPGLKIVDPHNLSPQFRGKRTSVDRASCHVQSCAVAGTG